jgi:hypothetical protein
MCLGRGRSSAARNDLICITIIDTIILHIYSNNAYYSTYQGGVLRLLQELASRHMLPLPTIHKRHMVHGGMGGVGGGGDFPAAGFECKCGCICVCFYASTCVCFFYRKTFSS